jgi:hypothetical protein
VNCNQELCIELLSVINFHCEIEPTANSLQYLTDTSGDDFNWIKLSCGRV